MSSHTLSLFLFFMYNMRLRRKRWRNRGRHWSLNHVTVELRRQGRCFRSSINYRILRRRALFFIACIATDCAVVVLALHTCIRFKFHKAAANSRSRLGISRPRQIPHGLLSVTFPAPLLLKIASHLLLPLFLLERLHILDPGRVSDDRVARTARCDPPRCNLGSMHLARRLAHIRRISSLMW